MAIHWYTPLLGPWDHKKVLYPNQDVVGNELDLGVLMDVAEALVITQSFWLVLAEKETVCTKPSW
jgi:hypothetical protein